MATQHVSTRSAYQRSSVLTASNGQLVVMLYDGAHLYLKQAEAAMAARDVGECHTKLRRAELIIQHLRTTLDHEQGGEVAGDLERIYVFCSRHLNEARIKRDPKRIAEVDTLLLELRDAWAQIASA